MVSIDQLKSYKFFKGFTDEELKKLADIATEELYKSGVQLWKKGDPANKAYFLEEGKVLLVMDAYTGPQTLPIRVTVDIVTKGECMGWSSVVEPYLYTLGARCIDDSKVIALDAVKLRSMFNEDAVLGFKFMHATAKVVATRLTHTEIILIGERGLSIMSE
ncbi:MAG: cyclic nucleotide-binding domain-containing protein [Syntrophales bacterium]